MKRIEKLNERDRLWEEIFHRFNILSEIEQKGHYIITSYAINHFKKNVQARLLCKFDNRGSLSPVFKKHGLGIIPIEKGKYLIAHFDLFQKISYENIPIKKANLRYKNLETLNENTFITSESSALHLAYLSDIYHQFLNVEAHQFLLPTFSGRMGAGNFSFKFSKSKHKEWIQVQGSQQIEIDAGYESNEFAFFSEAKQTMADDFCIRQLYYPYRTWKEKIHKPIKMIYMVYSNKNFYLSEYRFKNEHEYDSIELVKQEGYRIEKSRLKMKDIIEIARSTELAKETEGETPFPQADDFEKIINLWEMFLEDYLEEGDGLSKYDIARLYSISERQGDYYGNVGKYFGIVERHRGEKFKLNEKGYDIMTLSLLEKNVEFLKLLFQHDAIGEILIECILKGEKILLSEAQNILIKHGLQASGETQKRRAQSILSWYRWIYHLVI